MLFCGVNEPTFPFLICIYTNIFGVFGPSPPYGISSFRIWCCFCSFLSLPVPRVTLLWEIRRLLFFGAITIGKVPRGFCFCVSIVNGNLEIK